MTPRILVTDGDQRATLAVVRSLGRAGFHVEVCNAGNGSLSGASRYCDVEHRVPSPFTDPSKFAERVVRLCSDREIDVLLPITDASLLALLPQRQRLLDTRLPFASYEAYTAISDKAHLMRTAAGLGLCVPRQTSVEGPDSLPPDDKDLPAFPLVIKPSRSTMTAGGKRRQVGVRYANTRDELQRALSGYPPEAYPLLLQERIIGPGMGLFLLLWNGEVIASFAHRRLREKPPTGGVSVLREAIPLDTELLSLSKSLLDAYGWSGVAMVEFKRSSARGRAYLMEVNARFWGSLQLAIDAGVDFPRLLVELALGHAPAPISSYRVGTRSRWFLGDLDHLLLRFRRNYNPDELPPGSGGRPRALMAFFLTSLHGSRNEVMKLSDPRPGFRELVQWARRILR